MEKKINRNKKNKRENNLVVKTPFGVPLNYSKVVDTFFFPLHLNLHFVFPNWIP